MKRQYASIDIARYVSALLVVCIHTFPFLEISETFNTYFYSYCMSFGGSVLFYDKWILLF